MKLHKVRIRNYKRIEDSDWIELDDVTALVGGNETGKTSLLRALWKLKPARENIVLDAQDEFPRRRYTDDYLKGGKWPVSTVVFEIDKPTKSELIAIDEAFDNVERVEITNFYPDGKTGVDIPLAIEFEPRPELSIFNVADAQALAKDVVDSMTSFDYDTADFEMEVDGEQSEDGADSGHQEAVVEDFRQQVTAAIHEFESGLPEGDTPDEVREQLSLLASRLNEIAESDWQRTALADVLERVGSVMDSQPHATLIEAARKIIWDAVPVFIYFDDYNMLESRVLIPEALTKIAQGSTAPDVRSQWALFELTGFDIDKVANLS